MADGHAVIDVVYELFDELADMPLEERCRVLRERCGDDDALYAEALEILNLDSRIRQAGSAPQATDGMPDLSGVRIGRYILGEKLGEGGMGIIYLAEQLRPVRRKVAIKLIKPGMDSKSVLARFQAEQQALALMNHPNVARVFDAGMTDQDHPYFVMEHVPGPPITEYCDRNRLGLDKRLNLFLVISDAVQHAHQKGIIHRDLKPSNILVTEIDGEPIPKIIDFGVAKAMGQSLSEYTIYTQQGQLIGTPEYMSPEQAGMSAHDIDTRSDVYSLGVILYELLSGALPFDPRTLRAQPPAEIQRIIREEEPPRPSTRVSSLNGELTTSAERRRLEPRTLIRRLSGDLDWIVMKAIEKDRTRRYQSAGDFALDIHRYLTHEPVAAGPPTTTYRLRKFVRRNRAAVIAGALIATVFVLGSIGTSVGLVWGMKSQRQASEEAAIARAVNDFLNQDLLAAAVPSVELGKGIDVLMRDVLDAAARRIDDASGVGGRFEDKPLVEASIRQTLGVTYRRLGEFAAAEPHFERAWLLRRRALGEKHLDTVASMGGLAVVYGWLGRKDEAVSLHLEALAILTRVLGKEHPNTLGTMDQLANMYWATGRSDESDPLYLEVLEIRTRVLGEEHRSTLVSMKYVARLHESHGRHGEAELLYVKCYEIMKRVYGKDDPGTLVFMTDLATSYADLGRLAKAEPLFLENIETCKRIYGAEHPLTLWPMNNLAYIYAREGQYEKGEPLARRVVQTYREKYGESHGYTLMAQDTYGAVLLAAGRFEEAEALFRRVIRATERTREESWNLPMIRSHHGMSLAELGQYQEAEQLLLRAYPPMQYTREAAEIVRYLVMIYEGWDKPELADEWRARLPAAQGATASD